MQATPLPAFIALFALAIHALPAAAAAQQSAHVPATPVHSGAAWVSPPSVPQTRRVHIDDLPAVRRWQPGDAIVEVPLQSAADPVAPTPEPRNPVGGDDPLAARQRAQRAPADGGGFGTPVLNIEGIHTSAFPSDATGAVGTLQFVMGINGAAGSTVAIHDKATGAQIGPSFAMSSLVPGGTCATNAWGDPIILFDQAAGRWVLTEFTSAGNLLCVYLSSSADLTQTQTWTRYAFNFPSLPDYPKYGVWPQAYFVGASEIGTLGRVPLYAMDRARMLAGEPAAVQRLTVPSLIGFSMQILMPADVFGSAPPDGAPGVFVRHRDDEVHNFGSNNPGQDFLDLYELHVDWINPAASSVTGPIALPIAEFSSNINGTGGFVAFPQPNGIQLDPRRETLMQRLVYRRQPRHETLVGNFVTDLFLGPASIYPNDTGAIRWFELRRSPEPPPPDVIAADGFEPLATNGPWRVHQEGTWAPEDQPDVPANQADRWMGAIGVDRDGNIALGYNIVRQAPAIPVGLRYTGRLASDPLGIMTQGEHLIATGTGDTGTIPGAAQRWGDYNDLHVDPVDGCTFWFTGTYVNPAVNPTTSRANRFVAVRHPSCGAGPN